MTIRAFVHPPSLSRPDAIRLVVEGAGSAGALQDVAWLDQLSLRYVGLRPNGTAYVPKGHPLSERVFPRGTETSGAEQEVDPTLLLYETAPNSIWHALWSCEKEEGTVFIDAVSGDLLHAALPAHRGVAAARLFFWLAIAIVTIFSVSNLLSVLLVVIQGLSVALGQAMDPGSIPLLIVRSSAFLATAWLPALFVVRLRAIDEAAFAEPAHRFFHRQILLPRGDGLSRLMRITAIVALATLVNGLVGSVVLPHRIFLYLFVVQIGITAPLIFTLARERAAERPYRRGAITVGWKGRAMVVRATLLVMQYVCVAQLIWLAADGWFDISRLVQEVFQVPATTIATQIFTLAGIAAIARSQLDPAGRTTLIAMMLADWVTRLVFDDVGGIAAGLLAVALTVRFNEKLSPREVLTKAAAIGLAAAAGRLIGKIAGVAVLGTTGGIVGPVIGELFAAALVVQQPGLEPPHLTAVQSTQLHSPILKTKHSKSWLAVPAFVAVFFVFQLFRQTDSAPNDWIEVAVADGACTARVPGRTVAVEPRRLDFSFGRHTHKSRIVETDLEGVAFVGKSWSAKLLYLRPKHSVGDRLLTREDKWMYYGSEIPAALTNAQGMTSSRSGVVRWSQSSGVSTDTLETERFTVVRAVGAEGHACIFVAEREPGSRAPLGPFFADARVRTSDDGMRPLATRGDVNQLVRMQPIVSARRDRARRGPTEKEGPKKSRYPLLPPPKQVQFKALTDQESLPPVAVRDLSRSALLVLGEREIENAVLVAFDIEARVRTRGSKKTKPRQNLVRVLCSADIVAERTAVTVLLPGAEGWIDRIAKVVRVDRPNNLALLQLADSDDDDNERLAQSVLRLAPWAQREGTPFFAIGYPVVKRPQLDAKPLVKVLGGRTGAAVPGANLVYWGSGRERFDPTLEGAPIVNSAGQLVGLARKQATNKSSWRQVPLAELRIFLNPTNVGAGADDRQDETADVSLPPYAVVFSSEDKQVVGVTLRSNDNKVWTVIRNDALPADGQSFRRIDAEASRPIGAKQRARRLNEVGLALVQSGYRAAPRPALRKVRNARQPGHTFVVGVFEGKPVRASATVRPKNRQRGNLVWPELEVTLTDAMPGIPSLLVDENGALLGVITGEDREPSSLIAAPVEVFALVLDPIVVAGEARFAPRGGSQGECFFDIRLAIDDPTASLTSVGMAVRQGQLWLAATPVWIPAFGPTLGAVHASAGGPHRVRFVAECPKSNESSFLLQPILGSRFRVRGRLPVPVDSRASLITNLGAAALLKVEERKTTRLAPLTPTAKMVPPRAEFCGADRQFCDLRCAEGDLYSCWVAARMQMRSEPAQAAQRFKAVCALGENNACVDVAVLEAAGQHLPRDEAAAYDHLRIACISKYPPDACVGYASLLHSLPAPLRDRPKARNLLRTACASGHRLACRKKTPRLSELRRELGSVPCTKAAECLARAEACLPQKDFPCSEVFADKACSLGSKTGCFLHGHALEKQNRFRDAAKAYDHGCRNGVADACHNLGFIQFSSVATRAKMSDPQKAREAYEAACDLGKLDSCASSAALYSLDGQRKKANAVAQKGCDGGHKGSCRLVRKRR